MKWTVALVFLAGVAAPAADAPGFVLWTGDSMKQMSKTLAPKVQGGDASEKLGDMGNYNFALAYRNQSGAVEVHQKVADIFVIEKGEANLVTGGTVVDAKPSGPNEIRGTSIQGGQEHHLVAGDVLTIPANMPHQMKVPAGKEVLYMAIKVVQ